MNALDRINIKENQILYKKVGKKYIPTNDPAAYDGLREGFWLIKVAPGSTSIRQCVYPHTAEIQAAAREASDKIVDIIRKAGEARPREGVPLSEQAKKDWEWFIQRNGKEFNTLYYPSIQENADNILKELLKKS